MRKDVVSDNVSYLIFLIGEQIMQKKEYWYLRYLPSNRERRP
jgi:hypothetical protein